MYFTQDPCTPYHPPDAAGVNYLTGRGGAQVLALLAQRGQAAARGWIMRRRWAQVTPAKLAAYP